MTPELNRDILRCAAELAKIDSWTLFRYVKVDLEFNNIRTIEGQILSFEANCTGEKYLTCIIPSDTNEEKWEEVVNKLNVLMHANGKQNDGDYPDFNLTNNIFQALHDCGIETKPIIPDIRIYI